MVKMRKIDQPLSISLGRGPDYFFYQIFIIVLNNGSSSLHIDGEPHPAFERVTGVRGGEVLQGTITQSDGP